MFGTSYQRWDYRITWHASVQSRVSTGRAAEVRQDIIVFQHLVTHTPVVGCSINILTTPFFLLKKNPLYVCIVPSALITAWRQVVNNYFKYCMRAGSSTMHVRSLCLRGICRYRLLWDALENCRLLLHFPVTAACCMPEEVWSTQCMLANKKGLYENLFFYRQNTVTRALLHWIPFASSSRPTDLSTDHRFQCHDWTPDSSHVIK